MSVFVRIILAAPWHVPVESLSKTERKWNKTLTPYRCLLYHVCTHCWWWMNKGSSTTTMILAMLYNLLVNCLMHTCSMWSPQCTCSRVYYGFQWFHPNQSFEMCLHLPFYTSTSKVTGERKWWMLVWRTWRAKASGWSVLFLELNYICQSTLCSMSTRRCVSPFCGGDPNI